MSLKYTSIALKILLLKEKLNLTNAKFWKEYSTKETIENFFSDSCIELPYDIEENFKKDGIDGFVCCFDEDFPIINSKVKTNSDKPYLLFYKGNLSLLKNINNNVAVIGLTDPTEDIINREKKIVKNLVQKDLTIVSGLAKGCDSVAHITCLETRGKTIAILPTTIGKIYPAENVELAKNITDNNGLLLTEYYKEPKNKFEAVKRFTDRDRLQAMFSKAVIMIASYRKGEGDSGSHYAMDAAKKYEVDRFVMYNKEIDEKNIRFGLNKDFVNLDSKVKIISQKKIEEIVALKICNESALTLFDI